jgi:hypothetical protein
MALPLGQISMSEVNVELGLSSTALISLNDAAVRTLAGVGGAGTVISMQDLQGKSNQFSFTLSGSDVNLRTAAVNAGWNQTTKVVATINAPTTISSTSTGTAALTISGTFPNGVDLFNNGTIAGRGGNGGNGGNATVAPTTSTSGAAGSAGGLALSVSTPVSIYNNGTVAGGGGGGGGGGGAAGLIRGSSSASGGGGGGGGRGVSTGGSGGSGSGSSDKNANGIPGGNGTSTAAGTGGAGILLASNNNPSLFAQGGTGGNGGSFGSSGGAGGSGTSTFPTQSSSPGGGVGPAGACTSGGANITWVVTGTRLGALN